MCSGRCCRAYRTRWVEIARAALFASGEQLWGAGCINNARAMRHAAQTRALIQSEVMAHARVLTGSPELDPIAASPTQYPILAFDPRNHSTAFNQSCQGGVVAVGKALWGNAQLPANGIISPWLRLWVRIHGRCSGRDEGRDPAGTSTRGVFTQPIPCRMWPPMFL